MIAAVQWVKVVRRCASDMRVDHAGALSRRRDPISSLVRRFAWWTLRDETYLSLLQIGRASGYDHTTVLAGVRKFAREAGVAVP